MNIQSTNNYNSTSQINFKATNLKGIKQGTFSKLSEFLKGPNGPISIKKEFGDCYQHGDNYFTVEQLTKLKKALEEVNYDVFPSEKELEELQKTKMAIQIEANDGCGYGSASSEKIFASSQKSDFYQKLLEVVQKSIPWTQDAFDAAEKKMLDTMNEIKKSLQK